MELEPGNSTAGELYPLLQERQKLDRELPTESSSSETEEEEGSSENESSSHSSFTEGDNEGAGNTQSPITLHHCHN